jgi:hypothetical protein
MLFSPGTANTDASGGIYLRSARTLGLELLIGPLNDNLQI